MDMCVLSASLMMAECISGVPMSRQSTILVLKQDTASFLQLSCIFHAYTSILVVMLPKHMVDRPDCIRIKAITVQYMMHSSSTVHLMVTIKPDKLSILLVGLHKHYKRRVLYLLMRSTGDLNRVKRYMLSL